MYIWIFFYPNLAIGHRESVTSYSQQIAPPPMAHTKSSSNVAATNSWTTPMYKVSTEPAHISPNANWAHFIDTYTHIHTVHVFCVDFYHSADTPVEYSAGRLAGRIITPGSDLCTEWNVSSPDCVCLTSIQLWATQLRCSQLRWTQFDAIDIGSRCTTTGPQWIQSPGN